MSVNAARFAVPVRVRYFEADQQGVVFHMWYLAYFEDARNAFLTAIGLPLADLLALGCDLQVVHTQIDWQGSVHWGDEAQITVAATRIGTTSFTFTFEVVVRGMVLVTAQTVYVIIDATGVKRELPAQLRRALETRSLTEAAP